MRQKEEEDDIMYEISLDDSMAERRRKAEHNNSLEDRRSFHARAANTPGRVICDIWKDKHGDGGVLTYLKSELIPITVLPQFLLLHIDSSIEILVYDTQIETFGELGLRLDMTQFIYMVRVAKKELEREYEKEQQSKAKAEESGGFGSGIFDTSSPGSRR